MIKNILYIVHVQVVLKFEQRPLGTGWVKVIAQLPY